MDKERGGGIASVGPAGGVIVEVEVVVVVWCGVLFYTHADRQN